VATRVTPHPCGRSAMRRQKPLFGLQLIQNIPPPRTHGVTEGVYGTGHRWSKAAAHSTVKDPIWACRRNVTESAHSSNIITRRTISGHQARFTPVAGHHRHAIERIPE